MCYDFGGLVFGRAYTWRGVFSEFYGIFSMTSLFHFSNICNLSMVFPKVITFICFAKIENSRIECSYRKLHTSYKTFLIGDCEKLLLALPMAHWWVFCLDR